MNNLFFLFSAFFILQTNVYAQLNVIPSLIQKAISRRIIPSAVVVVSDAQGSPLFEEGFGPSHLDTTLYDLASLTKVLATTTAVMLLEERGLINLNEPIQKYIPGFNQGRKSVATIEDLLRHRSGLPADLNPTPGESFDSFFHRLSTLPLEYQPRTETVYSDLGFITLAVIVKKIAKQPISEFLSENVFIPLKMTSTFYQVPVNLHSHCAPAWDDHHCRPHDPIARAFYPVEVGHAGLFSTGPDLKRFVQMLLNLGTLEGKKIFRPETIKKMTTLPSGNTRGLGWDFLGPYATAPRGDVYPKGISYGHTGYTGSHIWIDPKSQSFIIVLTNRTLIDEGEASSTFLELRRDLSNAAARHFYP